ncbi:hypothetical protein [uncultured Ruegeria sp.]|uniref:hypothetical protein n=1 Tax=uncultured Ruegeria sp. TaxID=259304 RepID=UPI002621D224|nr:hypothetical protein [uncultured Ruegeria sp.]
MYDLLGDASSFAQAASYPVVGISTLGESAFGSLAESGVISTTGADTKANSSDRERLVCG